jgi:hypothetical protein
MRFREPWLFVCAGAGRRELGLGSAVVVGSRRQGVVSGTRGLRLGFVGAAGCAGGGGHDGFVRLVEFGAGSVRVSLHTEFAETDTHERD